MSLSVQLKVSEKVTTSKQFPYQESSPNPHLAVPKSLNHSPKLPFPLPLTALHPRNAFDSLQFVKPLRLKIGGIETGKRQDSQEIAPTEGSEIEIAVRRTELSESQGKATDKKQGNGQKSKEFPESAEKKPSKSMQPTPSPRKSLSLERLPDLHSSQPLTLTPIPELSHTLQPALFPAKLSPRPDYVPYTLQDYHMRLGQPGLGVLGASTIGSEEWRKRKEQEIRRKAYARVTFQRNCNQIAISPGRKPFKPAQPPSSRLRGLEFAKKLQLPTLNPHLSEAESEQLRLFAGELRARLLA